MKKHEITLSPEERQQLTTLTRQKTLPARKVERAKILLQADANGPHQSDTEIASALGIASTTVWRTKRLFAKQGLEASLEYARAVRFKPRKLDGRGEAKLIALACSAPRPVEPNGRCACWPTRSWNSRWLRTSPTRRCDAP
jgi:hypothetical protein